MKKGMMKGKPMSAKPMKPEPMKPMHPEREMAKMMKEMHVGMPKKGGH